MFDIETGQISLLRISENKICIFTIFFTKVKRGFKCQQLYFTIYRF